MASGRATARPLACSGDGGCVQRPRLLFYAGKEPNRLDEAEAGLAHDLVEVWAESADARRDPWQGRVVTC